MGEMCSTTTSSALPSGRLRIPSEPLVRPSLSRRSFAFFGSYSAHIFTRSASNSGEPVTGLAWRPTPRPL